MHVTLAILLAAWMPAATAAWETAPANPAGTTSFPTAFATDADGDRLEIFRDDEGRVYLHFVAHNRLYAFARGSCPTFQIDAGRPVHFFTIDNGCRVENQEVFITLGTIERRRITSAALYEIMNGTEVAFRYVTEDRRYHEARFELKNSNQVVRDALGRRTRVRKP